MVIIEVGHKKCSKRKKVRFEISESVLKRALAGFRDEKIVILMKYKKITKQSRWLHESDLIIKKISPNNNRLSSCDNPHCVDCENGYYERCHFRNK